MKFKSPLDYLEVKGFCMEPQILFGDRLVLDSRPDSYRPGDILVYQSSTRTEPMAHRLVRKISEQEYLISEDRDPIRQEIIKKEQILGRVLSIVRGDKVFSAGACSWMHGVRKPFVLFYSYLKNPAAKFFQPVLQMIQSIPAYKVFVRKIWAPQFAMVRVRDGLDRILALIGGRYAGHLDYSIFTVDGAETIWVSNIHVRIRYRGIGLASRLFFALSSQAGVRAYALACQTSLIPFYKKLGFGVRDESTPDYTFWLNKGYLKPGNHLLEKSV